VLTGTVWTFFNRGRAVFPFVLSTTVRTALLSTPVGSDMPEAVAVKTAQWFWNVGFYFEQQISHSDFGG